MARRGAQRREQRKARRAERSSARQQRRDRRSARQTARAERRQTRASRADTRRAERSSRQQARQAGKTERRQLREAGREQRAANRTAFFEQAGRGLNQFFGEGGLGRDILGGVAPGIFGQGEEEFGFEFVDFEPPPTVPEDDRPMTAIEALEDQLERPLTTVEKIGVTTGLPPIAIFGGAAAIAAGLGYLLLRRK